MGLLNLSMPAAGPYGSACPLTSRLQFHTLSFLNPADLQTVRALGIASRESTRCMFSTPISHACSFCLHPARRRCRACWTAFYCCKAHQAGHWKVHRVSCCVFQEQRKPIVFPRRRNHWFTYKPCSLSLLEKAMFSGAKRSVPADIMTEEIAFHCYVLHDYHIVVHA